MYIVIVHMYLYLSMFFILGVVPVSECTQETTRFTSDEGLNDEPSNRPTDINEESSETETHLGV